MIDKDKNEKLFDALLAVAVFQAFRQEMEQLPSNKELNRAYKPSPELEIQIKKHIKRSRIKAKRKHFAKSLGRAVTYIAIIFTLLTTAALSVEATRNAIFNTIIEWRDKYTAIQFEDSTKTKDTKQNGLYYPTYIPEGFKKTETEKFGNTIVFIYGNETGEEIIFDQNPDGTVKTSVDNENTIYTEIEISGNKAHLFEGTKDEDASVLIWESEGIVFTLISQSVDITDDLIRMGESIEK